MTSQQQDEHGAFADHRLGGDPAAMRRAAYEFDQQAERLRSCGESVAVDIHQAWWRGPDADQFRTDWEDIHRNAGTRISAQLREFAAALREAAEQQERVSRA